MNTAKNAKSTPSPVPVVIPAQAEAAALTAASTVRGNAWQAVALDTLPGTPERIKALRAFADALEAEWEAAETYIAALTA